MPYKDKEKQKEFQREWLSNRRDRYLKDNGPCIKCGSWNNLEIDHVSRNGKITHRIWSWTEKRRNEELAKCQILCGECHKKKTGGENQKPITHGKRSSYYARGCRCSECAIAKKQEMTIFMLRLG